MPALGLLLILVGAWVTYCGFYGISPFETLQAIIKEPSSIDQIISDAKKKRAVGLSAITALFGQKATTGGRSVGKPGGGSDPSALGKDAYDPISSKYALNEGWEEHKSRGSAGGLDFTAPSGTPLFAPFSGVVSFDTDWGNGSSGGTVITVTAESGWKSQYLHCSKIVDSLEGQSVKAGTVVGYSGGSVGVPGTGNVSTGAHIHWHLVSPSGVRTNPQEYFK